MIHRVYTFIGIMTPSESYKNILSEIPQQVTLIAVSKTHPSSAVKEVYDAGCRHFGENKAQEMIAKQAELPDDIRWHMIGHLQTNKVRSIIPITYLIHSVDSVKLLHEINKEADKAGKVQKCLLQFHVAMEETKFGFSQEEAFEMLNSETFRLMKNISICGIMGMASFTNNEALVRSEFGTLKSIFDEMKKNFFDESPDFIHLSMGMSGDYRIAMEEGSTMVRIGTTIFGQRDYSNK